LGKNENTENDGGAGRKSPFLVAWKFLVT